MNIDVDGIFKLIFDPWKKYFIHPESSKISKLFSVGWLAARCREDISHEERNTIVYEKMMNCELYLWKYKAEWF